MRLLVTGGAGFIGSNFILHWLRKHPKDLVINFDKLTYAGNLENLPEAENNPNYAFVKGDISSPSDVRKVMKDAEIVVNFAAESHVDRALLDAEPFVITNVVGTHILLKEALRTEIKRFHHVSTDEVYGALSLEDKVRFNEKTPYSLNL